MSVPIVRKFGLSQLVSGQHVMVSRDRSTPLDQTRTGVILCHGRSYGSAPFGIGALSHTYGEYVPAALAKAGYIVAEGDDGGGHRWGNSAVTNAISDLRTALQAPHTRGPKPTGLGAKTGKVWIGGFSLGTLAALRAYMVNPSWYHGLFLFCPAPDMAYHRGTGGAMPAEMDAEWGGSAALDAAMATINPAQNPGSFVNCPMRVYDSTNDTSCPPASLRPFFAAVTAAGNTNCTVQSMGAIGHSPGAADVGNYLSTAPKVDWVFADLLAWMKGIAAP